MKFEEVLVNGLETIFSKHEMKFDVFCSLPVKLIESSFVNCYDSVEEKNLEGALYYEYGFQFFNE